MPAATIDDRVADVLKGLERRGTKRNRDGMTRYAIVSPRAFGVSVGDLRDIGRRLGRDHELALALMGLRLVRSADAVRVRRRARARDATADGPLAGDFDNWAICDGICFHLFDKTPHAWQKVDAWAAARQEFVRRAAFALLAALALHDRTTADERFLATLPLIEGAAFDERSVVKKGVSWALRGMGSRSAPLHAAVLELARQLAASEGSPARWIGKDTLRDLNRPLVRKRLAARTVRVRKR